MSFPRPSLSPRVHDGAGAKLMILRSASSESPHWRLGSDSDLLASRVRGSLPEEAVALCPHPLAPPPARQDVCARTSSRGRGEVFQGGGGPLAPRLLELLHPVRRAPRRGSAMSCSVEYGYGAERPTGL